MRTLSVVLNNFNKNRSRRRHFPQFNSELIILRRVGTLFAVSTQKPSRKNRKSTHFAEKLSPSGRVAQGAERGFRLPELSLKVFPLGGENISFGLNWEKVARMRRKRGARRLKIRTDDINTTNIHTYFKSEEAPLCRFYFRLITISRRRHFPQFSSILIYASQVGTLYVVLNNFIKNRSWQRHFLQFNRKIMIKSAEWEHFPPQRPLPSAMPPPSPKGKAVTSSVGNAATFPKREGKVLFRRQSRHLPRKGRQ